MKKMMPGGIALLLSASLSAQPPQQSGQPKPPPVAERWTHDSTRLQLYVGLSATQVGSVKTVFTAFYHSMDAAVQSHASAPPDREVMEKNTRELDEALDRIFTPEQKIRFSTFRKEMLPPPPRTEGLPPPVNF